MTVEPIRNMKDIKAVINYLKEGTMRDYLLFMFGVNTGLRIGDIIILKYSDVFDEKGNFKQYLVIRERKTYKEKKIKLNDSLKKALKSFISHHPELRKKEFIFASRKGGYISRIQAYRVLKKAANTVGLENFGTHSMRKTWGYHTYKASKYNIGLIMDMFNHSSQKVTLRYIGISQDQKDELFSIVQFG
ncbi:MAG: recombinase XerD [Firmicutes bacterium HGW-Firmicutes-14]|jgi:integrase|nr:MAG: recombinase XerD [Firmicutes bacterium HGW-Firmicutes-14]